MDKIEIQKLLNNENISNKEKLDILFNELNDTYFNVGYYNAKASHIELIINEVKKNNIN